jgi:type II secretory pathway predicted ATPase ExeA
VSRGQYKDEHLNALTLERKQALEATAAEREACVAELRDYLDRTGLHPDDFARRLGYGGSTLRLFLAGQYHHVGKSDGRIRKAILDYIGAHPIAPPTQLAGELYDTANVRAVMETFDRLLIRPVAYMLYAPPGSQKTFTLQNAVADLNRRELPKNGHGARAYYVYARQNLRPRDLMKRIAIACGVPATQEIDRILMNLRHDLNGRRVLLCIDESQHLDIECLEVVRELLDQPPNFSLLFAGSHDLHRKFDQFARQLEQWNSRIIAKVKLPGLLKDEARGIIEREIGGLLGAMPESKAERQIEHLIVAATSEDAYDGGKPYINVRTLTNALDQIKAAAPAKELACK